MSRSEKLYLYLPSIGLVLFLLCYFYATTLYPGGISFQGPHPTAFSWTQNYWCDLLDTITYNNQHNPARPYAILAMLIVGASISGFWYLSTRLYQSKQFNSLIRIFGILGITSILLIIFDSYHNLGLILAGSFSSIAFTLSLFKLRQEKHHQLFWFGIIVIITTTISYTFFFSRYNLEVVPITQKINFLLIFMWVASLNHILVRDQTTA